MTPRAGPVGAEQPGRRGPRARGAGAALPPEARFSWTLLPATQGPGPG